uniref:Protein root UVB sensitive/RUS domain-containing protein n=1 Tax=Chromera velia CCMP2878 TaxID=1169474 RepID=A0A0G4G9L5_9ALVE|eukprot:Cvel_20822.t1-p1 / transcript=Cvel_20822.t1 / gene=Cvel_20822 / organism=Chromera_velia_CCMP2878 / gene_product=UPF0420 protein C16orf58 homolog, putative / transcript_product=UPF0420 protein C16orf58 homolog, putative / location=Cvel_scaffold1904:9650-12551(-) / protein_length=849 / sequence_SO=supercontig / SO=protein_coding / is_pseudo=false
MRSLPSPPSRLSGVYVALYLLFLSALFCDCGGFLVGRPWLVFHGWERRSRFVRSGGSGGGVRWYSSGGSALGGKAVGVGEEEEARCDPESGNFCCGDVVKVESGDLRFWHKKQWKATGFNPEGLEGTVVRIRQDPAGILSPDRPIVVEFSTPLPFKAHFEASEIKKIAAAPDKCRCDGHEERGSCASHTRTGGGGFLDVSSRAARRNGTARSEERPPFHSAWDPSVPVPPLQRLCFTLFGNGGKEAEGGRSHRRSASAGTSLASPHRNSSLLSVPVLEEVIGPRRGRLEWSERRGRYLPVFTNGNGNGESGGEGGVEGIEGKDGSAVRMEGVAAVLSRAAASLSRLPGMERVVTTVQHALLPDNVTPDYYSYTFWRMVQRFLSATVNVFGTQALLLALGIKSRNLGAAAALSWVFKDAFGKGGRILWASRMGRAFDGDAKKWRFRSSVLFAIGNGLEVLTYAFPKSFLVFATAANSFKQISVLTSSATRNAVYASFAAAGGGRNIGDITAKGEAQVAVVDLMGMLSGIALCRLIGTAPRSIALAYMCLSCVDISCIYKEIRSVVFRWLNNERSHLCALPAAEAVVRQISLEMERVTDKEGKRQREQLLMCVPASFTFDKTVPSPAELAKRERVVLPGVAGAELFGSPRTCGCSPDAVRSCLELWGDDVFVVHMDPSRVSAAPSRPAAGGGALRDPDEEDLECFPLPQEEEGEEGWGGRLRFRSRRGRRLEGFSVWLKSEATGEDTLRAIYTVACIRTLLDRYLWQQEEDARARRMKAGSEGAGGDENHSADDGCVELPVYGLLAAGSAISSQTFDAFHEEVKRMGWKTDHFMYGKLPRVDWTAGENSNS